MIWEKLDKNTNEYISMQSPASYSADIEDTDNDSYSSVVDGSLIDNPIAVGMLKLSMSWEFNTEEEANALMQATFENPLILKIRVPVVDGGILTGAKFRVSKRKVELIQCLNEKPYWKASFNLMQKELTDAQKQAVEGVN